MLRGTIDASASVRFPTSDRPDVNDMPGVPCLHLCSGVSVGDSYSRPGRLTANEFLGHVDEPEDIGVEHPLHVSRGYFTDALRSEHVASVINCGMAYKDRTKKNAVNHTYQGRRLILIRPGFCSERC